MSRLLYADESLTQMENLRCHNMAVKFVNLIEDRGGFNREEAKKAGGRLVNAEWNFDPSMLTPFVLAVMEDRGYDIK